MYTIVFVDFLFSSFVSIEALFRKILEQVHMSKPNTEFTLGLRDIDLIEEAINCVIARRSSELASLAAASFKEPTDIVGYRETKTEVDELRDLLGRIHNQKNWYRPKSEAVYVSG